MPLEYPHPQLLLGIKEHQTEAVWFQFIILYPVNKKLSHGIFQRCVDLFHAHQFFFPILHGVLCLSLFPCSSTAMRESPFSSGRTIKILDSLGEATLWRDENQLRISDSTSDQ